MARVLRPGGRFLLVDSVAPSDPELAAFLNQLETRRDLTHQRTLPADTWLAMFYAAGLPPLGYEYFPRHHDLDDWLARAQTPPPAQAEVRAMLADASPAAKAAFAIECVAGQPTVFTDQKILIWADRPGM